MYFACSGISYKWLTSSVKTYLQQLFIIFKINFYWSIFALQCCVSFAIPQSASATYISMYPLFFGFLSHLVHHRALGRVPWAILWILISYLFCTWYQYCLYVDPNIYYLLAMPCSLWDLSSLTRDWTWALTVKVES